MRVRRRRLPAAVAVAALLTTSGCFWNKSEPGPGDVAQAFLDGWGGGDAAAAAAKTDAPDQAAAGIQALAKGLGDGAAVAVTRGAVTAQKDSATAAYTARWTLPGLAAPWTYDGVLPLVHGDDGWSVRWAWSDLHPKLTAAPELSVQRVLPARAALQDAAGQPIFVRTPVVSVGVEPDKVTDLPVAGGDAGVGSSRSRRGGHRGGRDRRPSRTAFVPVITLAGAGLPRREGAASTTCRGRCSQSGEPAGRAEPRGSRRPLLGRVGEATAEVLKEARPVATPPDDRARRVRAAAVAEQASSPAPPGRPHHRGRDRHDARHARHRGRTRPGTAVRTTLDRSGADRGGRGGGDPVPQADGAGGDTAVDRRDPGRRGQRRRPRTRWGLAGRYPGRARRSRSSPSTALLSAKARVQPDLRRSTCPGTTVVYGKQFENEDQFDLGTGAAADRVREVVQHHLHRAVAETGRTTALPGDGGAPSGSDTRVVADRSRRSAGPCRRRRTTPRRRRTRSVRAGSRCQPADDGAGVSRRSCAKAWPGDAVPGHRVAGRRGTRRPGRRPLCCRRCVP